MEKSSCAGSTKELTFYISRSSSSLSFSKASSCSSSLTSIRDVDWVVPSPEGSGYKEVSPDISTTCTSHQGNSNMRMHVKGYDKVCITKREGLKR
jgi:hypothetical protein